MELEDDTQLIWCGDFNSFFDCKLDADGTKDTIHHKISISDVWK